MKNYVILFLLFSGIRALGQGIQIGEKVPVFQVDLVDAEQSVFSFEPSNGKALLIDFWASWCSPCLATMPHLEELQTKFEGRLEVIAVSEEKYERISRFQEKKPFQFLFARDTGSLRALFPYQVIPHSVLIAPDGRLVAITSPDHISAQVIEEVLADKKIDLPIKKDHFDFDPAQEYFDFEEGVKQAFQLQPYMSGIPAFSRKYNEGPFKNRRITIFNLNLAGLYRKAYHISSFRLRYEFDKSLIDWEDTRNRFCLNVIAESTDQLYPYMRAQLQANTPILAEASLAEIEVLVITQGKEGIKANLSKESGTLQARGDGFKKKGTTIREFCDYLESFGIVGMAVVDETGDSRLYDIDFSFDPENPESFKKAMSDLGLSYQKGVRKTEVLILSMKEKP